MKQGLHLHRNDKPASCQYLNVVEANLSFEDFQDEPEFEGSVEQSYAHDPQMFIFQWMSEKCKLFLKAM